MADVKPSESHEPFTMKRILLTTLVLVICEFFQAHTNFAQTRSRPPAQGKVILRNVGLAKVSVSKGALRRTVDLSDQVVGCAYVQGKIKGMLDKQGCAAPSATFKLIDSAAQDGSTYLVVLSNAMGNCNVCGQCGAAEAFALIWVELDPNLRVRIKKSVPIEDCRTFVQLVNPETELSAESEIEAPKLAFKGDRLVVEFERRIFEEDTEKGNYEFSHLEYNRKKPKGGFVVSSEKRAQSSLKGQ